MNALTGIFLSVVGILDYLDDYVNKRIINISILLSIFGPFSHWVFYVYARWDNPFLLLSWFYSGSLLLCFFVLLPMALGNKKRATLSRGKICFSILCCATVIVYQIFVFIGWEFSRFPSNIRIVYRAHALSSALLALFAIANYVYIACKPPSTHQLFAIQKLDSLNDVSSVSKSKDLAPDPNPESNTAENMGYLQSIKQFFWPKYMGSTVSAQHSEVIYPSRLYAGVYLGILGTLIVFEITMRTFTGIDSAVLRIKQALSAGATTIDNIKTNAEGLPGLECVLYFKR